MFSEIMLALEYMSINRLSKMTGRTPDGCNLSTEPSLPVIELPYIDILWFRRRRLVDTHHPLNFNSFTYV